MRFSAVLEDGMLCVASDGSDLSKLLLVSITAASLPRKAIEYLFEGDDESEDIEGVGDGVKLRSKTSVIHDGRSLVPSSDFGESGSIVLLLLLCLTLL